MFGADDADWAIYRKIVSEFSALRDLLQLTPSPSKNTAAPSSDEEEDLVQLHSIEHKLLSHDPTFTDEHTHASLSSQRSALISAFRPQYEEGDVEGMTRDAHPNDPLNIFYIPGRTRIHLNVERWRVCETWFSPSMAGVDSAGLGEVLQNVLARFSDREKGRLVKVSPSSLYSARTLI